MPDLQRYAYKVYYDGIGFYGFQRQPKVRTIEEELIRALTHTRAVPRDPVIAAFASAGRTDRFVSALGNVFAVNAERYLTPAAINSWLSKGIRVWSSALVPSSFNPRHALRRNYKYLLQREERINLDLMRKAAEMFLGVHDFRRFAHRPPEDCSARRIYELSIEPRDDFICISIVGDSFLRRMVRKIVGVLVYVASGVLGLEEVRQLFDPMSPFPPMGVPAAPPRNLILWDVDYGFSFEIDKYALKKMKLEMMSNLMELVRSRTILGALQDLAQIGAGQNGVYQ
jgi:tRNA pseudouridine38-40 synthase